MTDDYTFIEPIPNRAAEPQRTFIEGAPVGERTFIEPSEAASGSRDVINLVPGAEFGDYRLISPMPVSSGEADLWQVEHCTDGNKFVLKLYRYGLAPKPHIVEAVRRLRREHVVDVVKTGERGERYYEIQEYIEHGSLAEMIKEGGLTDERVQEVLKELAIALCHLHEANVLHRDIKPSNVLVRTVKPLDLVLTDFGISSLTDVSLHQTSLNRTVAYCAPEASVGTISKASDWWSLGILLIELLTGKHPFAGLAEVAILYRVTTQRVPIPQQISPAFQMLIKGLLTRDPQARWGSEQVMAWLPPKARRDIPLGYEEEAKPGSYNYKPYKFGGKDYYDFRELAAALATDWKEGVKSFSRGYITEWVKRDVGEHELAGQLQDITDDPALTSADHKLSVAVLALDRKLPLSWKGQVMTPESLPGNVDIAISLLESSVPEWYQKLHKDHSLIEIRKRRQTAVEWLTRLAGGASNETRAGRPGQITIDFQQANYLTLCNPQQVIESAQRHRSQFVDATDPQLKDILQMKQLSDKEAIAVLACDQTVFLTKKQVRQQKSLAALKRYVDQIDHERLDQLLDVKPDRLIQEACEYRNRFKTSTDSRIRALLKKDGLTYLEALAILVSPRRTLLTPNQARKRIITQVTSYIDEIDDEEFDALFAAERGQVIENALAYRTHFAASTNPSLDPLLQKDRLTHIEAMALLLAPRRVLLTPFQATIRDLRKALIPDVIAGAIAAGCSSLGAVAGAIVGLVVRLVVWMTVGLVTWDSETGGSAGRVAWFVCLLLGIAVGVVGSVRFLLEEAKKRKAGDAGLPTYELPAIGIVAMGIVVLLSAFLCVGSA